MVRVIAIDKDGNNIGKVVTMPLENWKNLQKFGKMLRWRKVESTTPSIDNATFQVNKPILKKQKNEKRKRRGSGNSV